ncbi:hypothetical protein [Nocardiopsis lambiniae]|uniref:Uncharacterized protein n=1 Tax=Nocardiopsis lambiniae TaxID=3075539 RepID=A0ABU2M6B2_9ACTN|nr:hypothetical protein [Nocardiopsis sp. DSM 44743]MDT0328047.1 hypothetical protein [Nocardiopsis sp. DSM 44743]
MRRTLALASTVCLFALTACTGTADDTVESVPDTVEDLAEEGPSGLALVHRGYEGGDPETDQVLVFHDAVTGQPLHRFDLPDGSVDPMATEPPVHARFSEDWAFFVYATREPNAVHIAVLTDSEETPPTAEPTEGEEPSAFFYLPVESIAPSAGEVLSDPVVHGDRLWFVSDDPQDANPPRVLSVPLSAPSGTPNQEGSLPLGENRRPSDWSLTPEGALHIRDSVQTRQVGGGGNLVVRQTGDSVVNATLSVDGGQWQSFDDAPVWGAGTALLRSDGSGGEPPKGAYLVTVDAQGHTATRILENADGPVAQYALPAERDAVLAQTPTAWFRVDLDENGTVTGTEELFPRFHDSSMDGWPLAVRWVRTPVAIESPSPTG